ncbi:MAG: PAS-domain containing protein [Proteobacteria bacterium]|nr:PAS-domain containing protein [Pseudomonadota bacterium]
MKWPSILHGRGAAAAIALAAAALIAVIWYGTANSLRTNRAEVLASTGAELSSEALLLADRLDERLTAVDQTLRILESQWESSPDTFRLADWRQRVVVLADPGLQILITDAAGMVRVATAADLIGTDVADRAFFRHWARARADSGQMFIGQAARDPSGAWSLTMSRRLDLPDGAFAGVIAVSYDVARLTQFYSHADNHGDLGPHGLFALVRRADGIVQAAAGDGLHPGDTLAGSAMWRGLRDAATGRWTGPSGSDGEERVHVLKPLRVAGSLDVVLAMGVQDAVAPVGVWRRDALLLAALATLLVLALAGGLVLTLLAARRRVAALGRDRAILAAAKADADAKSRRLEATLASMSDGVMMMDADLRMVEWNARVPELLRLPPSALWRGVPMATLLRAQAEAGEFGPVADIDAEVERRLKGLRGVTGTVEYERVRPDGRVIQVRRRRLADGGFISHFADITERKRAEDALRQARFVAEATSEAKSRFAAIVSHEIRQPLNALLNSLSLLASGELPAPARRLLATARQSGEALRGLLSDVLEMSKMEAGQMSLRPAVFALRPLMQGVVDIFADQAAARGIVLAIAVAPETPERLHADPVRIRQILVNLVSNAVKFASPGRVVLSAGLVATAGAPPGAPMLLRLAVRDPGPAIDPAGRARLFQPFVQLGVPDAGGEAGTGLGLTVCRTLAKLLGGGIGYEPTKDGGNSFWVTVAFRPVDAEARDAVGARAADGAQDGVLDGAPDGARRLPVLPRTRVLLVEDVRANQLVIARLLRRGGHLVDVAGSGAAAIRAVMGTPYDAVLMDVRMPGMNGIDATRFIRALPGAAGGVPICALTGDVGAADWDAYRAAGMDEVLSKPVELGALLAMLGRLVWRGRPVRTSDPPVAAPPPPAGELPAVLGPRIAELRVNLSPAVLADLVGKAMEELEQLMAQLRAALTAADAAGIEAHAHAMAGLAGSYALAALEHRAQAVVAAVRTGGPARAAASAGDLEALLAESCAALREAACPVPAQ